MSVEALASEQQREFVGIIDAQAKRLTALVNDLLTLSSIEAGGPRTSLAPITLAAVIHRTVRELGLDVAVDCGDDIVLADEALLQQSLVNYLGNARSHRKVPTDQKRALSAAEYERLKAAAQEEGVEAIQHLGHRARRIPPAPSSLASGGVTWTPIAAPCVSTRQ